MPANSPTPSSRPVAGDSSISRMGYFGVMKRPGHYWFGLSEHDLPESLRAGNVDAKLAPQSPSQPQGLCLRRVIDGVTVVSFWDRTGDSRGNSNSTFAAWGDHSFEEMVAAARALFPDVMRRLDAAGIALVLLDGGTPKVLVSKAALDALREAVKPLQTIVSEGNAWRARLHGVTERRSTYLIGSAPIHATLDALSALLGGDDA